MAVPGSRDDDFTAFVLARSARLVHFARMLCGDAELAEVASIAYTFPDGQTTKAVIKGDYWVMQHQTATPWKEGSPQGAQIQVALYLANGQPTRSFLLSWGEDTCAQISHGC